jgi:hypothetical protein
LSRMVGVSRAFEAPSGMGIRTKFAGKTSGKCLVGK